ncbi:DDE-type integrase/transposase/recombinase [Tenacibaculum sp. MAR_2009_124]|uniref:DDE-type integrase/transposase/recombinase n=1 Tax=Tenacibaculum sp. MAR_2009_124 TaxID=1250059 RepID=UPI00397C328B
MDRPEKVWVNNITYIGTRDNSSYLALITNAYSQIIVGYNASDSLAVEDSLKALQMALYNRKHRTLPLRHHSDRGL